MKISGEQVVAMERIQRENQLVQRLEAWCHGNEWLVDEILAMEDKIGELDRSIGGMSKYQEIARRLRELSCRENRGDPCDESEAEFQGRLAYQRALETVAQVIEEVCDEQA